MLGLLRSKVISASWICFENFVETFDSFIFEEQVVLPFQFMGYFIASEVDSKVYLWPNSQVMYPDLAPSQRLIVSLEEFC